MTDLSWLAPVVPAVPGTVTTTGNTAKPHEHWAVPGVPAVPAEKGNVPQQRGPEITLAELIPVAGLIYQHDDDDRRIINTAAQRDPDGLRLALLTDPLIVWHLSARLGPVAP